jgi:Rab GDP dissociation inhibitor
MVSSVHNVCKQGHYIAIISTNVETNNPEAELAPAFAIVGAVDHKFITVNSRNIYTKENLILDLSVVPYILSTFNLEKKTDLRHVGT